MPGGDKTGPPARSGGRGMGIGRAGGSGRMGGNRSGAGPGGECVCRGCGEHLSHQAGTPCFNMTCPKCGSRMVRS